MNDAACQVIGPLVPFTCTLTARLSLGRCWRDSGTGSLTASWPAGTATERRPENVSVRLVPGSIVPAVACTASVTCPKVTGCVPNTLVSRSLHTRPPMLGWMIMRSV